MAAVLEERKKALEKRKEKISLISDSTVKEILFDIVDDITKCVEDSDKIIKSHNKLIQRQNDDSIAIMSTFNTVGNLAQGIGKLTDGFSSMKHRVQSLEVASNSNYEGHTLNIIMKDEKDATEIENGTIRPMQKFSKILNSMNINIPRDITDVNILSMRRFVNGTSKPIKLLKARFNNTVTPGRIFGRIVKHNRSLKSLNDVRYYAEIPTSKLVWDLKRICLELKNEKVILNVRGCDRGLLATYKDPQNGDTENYKTRLVTCEKDIDELRSFLKVADAHISVSEKYTEEFWMKKRKTHKRDREMDDSDQGNTAKKSFSTFNNA